MIGYLWKFYVLFQLRVKSCRIWKWRPNSRPWRKPTTWGAWHSSTSWQLSWRRASTRRTVWMLKNSATSSSWMNWRFGAEQFGKGPHQEETAHPQEENKWNLFLMNEMNNSSIFFNHISCFLINSICTYKSNKVNEIIYLTLCNWWTFKV